MQLENAIKRFLAISLEVDPFISYVDPPILILLFNLF